MLEKVYTKLISPANGRRPRSTGAAGVGVGAGIRRLRVAAFGLGVPIGVMLPAIVALGIALALSSCSARSRTAGPAGGSQRPPAAAQAASPGTPDGTSASPQPGGGAGRPGDSRGGGQPTGSAGELATAGGRPAGAVASDGRPAADRAAGPGAVQSGAYVVFVQGTVRTGRLASNPGGRGDAAVQDAVSPAPARLVRVGDPVGAGEILATASASAVELRIGEDFDVGLGENTTVELGGKGALGIVGRNGGPVRLELTLQRGSLMVRAGRQLVSAAAQPSAVQSAINPPLLVEIHSPELFLSSRGGSLLVTDSGSSTLCAVGAGQAWLLPESVVYPDLIEGVSNRTTLALLNEVLAHAVAIGSDQQLTVPSSRLSDIDKVGGAIREILVANKGARELPQIANEAFTALAEKAVSGVAGAIGTPEPISEALRRELDPASVHHQQMKTTSVTESGLSGTKPTGGSPRPGTQTAASPGSGIEPTATAAAAGTAANAAGTAPAAAAPAAAAASTSAGASAQAPVKSGSKASPIAEGAGAASTVRSFLDRLFAPAGSGQSSHSGQAGSSSPAAGSPGSFPGPTPPTPPTPPKVP